LGENSFEDIPAENTSNEKETVDQALKIAREKQVKGIYFHGDFCRDHNKGIVDALKELPIEDMKVSWKRKY
jgi:hypothetical protein